MGPLLKIKDDVFQVQPYCPSHYSNNTPLQVSSHYLKQCWYVFWCIYVSLGSNELTRTVPHINHYNVFENTHRKQNTEKDVFLLKTVPTNWNTSVLTNIITVWAIVNPSDARTEYFLWFRSMPWPLMTCLLANPGHQQPQHSLHSTDRSLSSIGKEFNILYTPHVEKW